MPDGDLRNNVTNGSETTAWRIRLRNSLSLHGRKLLLWLITVTSIVVILVMVKEGVSLKSASELAILL